MMRLSEAMRLGSMLAPQGFGQMEDGAGNICAFMAAVRAANLPIYPPSSFGGAELPTRSSAGTATCSIAIPDEWAAVLMRNEGCPCCHRGYVVSELIPHLNDVHRWPREKIATEFVEPIERMLGLWNEPKPQERFAEIFRDFLRRRYPVKDILQQLRSWSTDVPRDIEAAAMGKKLEAMKERQLQELAETALSP